MPNQTVQKLEGEIQKLRKQTAEKSGGPRVFRKKLKRLQRRRRVLKALDDREAAAKGKQAPSGEKPAAEAAPKEAAQEKPAKAAPETKPAAEEAAPEKPAKAAAEAKPAAEEAAPEKAAKAAPETKPAAEEPAAES